VPGYRRTYKQRTDDGRWLNCVMQLRRQCCGLFVVACPYAIKILNKKNSFFLPHAYALEQGSSERLPSLPQTCTWKTDLTGSTLDSPTSVVS